MATVTSRSPRGDKDANSVRRSPDQAGIFFQTGEYWTLGLGASTFALKDSKGLSYIQRLLREPGRELHALDLLGVPVGIAIREGLTGDAGEMLDAQAKAEYRRRLRELGEELEDQRERGNHERADQIEAEIDFLEREIERAVGRGGRDRRYGSNAERARLSVSRAIRTALDKVAEQHAALGERLGRCIRTGSYCSYIPDPEHPIAWRLSTDGTILVSEVPVLEADRARKDASILRAFTAGTTFVGRMAERAALTRMLGGAQSREGKTVLIGGGAGVGKTRIAAEIAAEAARRGMIAFVGGCYDRDEAVSFGPFVEIVEAALARSHTLAAFRGALGDHAPEVARLVPQLRRVFPDIATPAELPPEQSRRLLFNAVTELFTRLSGHIPLFVLLDDLQWADEGSLLLLGHLAQFVPTIPLMIVGTFRDFELDAASALNRTLGELVRSHLAERITLSGLPQESVADMLHALSGRRAPPAVVQLFCANTEGNPFFVEELFRHLVEQGRLIDSAGEFRDDLRLGEHDLPENLRLVLGSRLARLGDGTRKALETAAVIGRSFTFDLLSVSAGVDADSMLAFLEEAEGAGVITSTLEYPEARFQFSHELVRQAVLSGLSAPRRQRFHLRVAYAIERIYVNVLEDHVEDLAHHLWEAGTAADLSKTIEYLEIASRRALLQSAYDAALRHLRNALELLKTLPDSPSRAAQELALQTALGGTLMATKGYAASDVESAFQRARILSRVAADSPKQVSVLWGLWASSFVGGKHRAARELAEQSLCIAQNHDDPIALLQGNLMLGISCLYQGELQSARSHLERCRDLPDRRLPQGHGDHPSIVSRSWLGVTLLRLGYPDQGLKAAQEALWMARQLERSRSRNEAFAMNYVATLHMERQEFAKAREIAEQMAEVSNAQGLTQWSIAANILVGVTMAEQGALQEGAARLGEALAAWRATGASTSTPVFMGKLGTFYCKLGRIDEALSLLDDALALSFESGEVVDSAELYRRKGVILLSPIADTRAHEEPERSLLDAIRIARDQEAKYYELRAAIDLGHLWKRQGKRRQAREILAEIYAWYTEGLATADLKQASALIAELA